MWRKSKMAAGFTLLEILVALFIFSIIALIMTHALHIVFESQERTESRAARLANLQIATLFLAHDLSQATNRPIINAGGSIEPAFIGKPDNVTFTHGGDTNPQGELLRSTLQRVKYSNSDKKFIRETWQVLDQISTSKSDQRQLLDDVTEIRFEYLDDKGKFGNRWPPANKTQALPLPNAVKIFLTLAHWGTISQIYVIPGKAFVTQQS
jgi:general secretion pathway protein J